MKVKVKLKDITSYSKGQQINKEDVLDNGKYNYLNGGMDFSGKVNLYNVDINTVTVSEGGNSCGYVNYIDYPFWCGAHCYYLYNNIINTKYLYYALKSQQNRLMKLRSGACMPNIKKSVLGDFEFYIDNNKDKQKQIVSILDTVSGIIEKRKKQLEDLDELVKARFVEMFGDPVENPMGWDVVSLGKISKVGSSKRVFVDELKEKGIPFYRGTEIGLLAEGKCFNPDLFISEEHYDKLINSSGKPQKGDLLMPSICPDGRIWLVNTDKKFYFKDGRVLWVHSINKKYNPKYILFCLKNIFTSDYSSIASGTTFAELKIFSLKKCNIFDVSLELQNQFADFVKQTEEMKEKVQKSLDETQVLFDSLMQKYF